jgi:hypothetical protein
MSKKYGRREVEKNKGREGKRDPLAIPKRYHFTMLLTLA